MAWVRCADAPFFGQIRANVTLSSVCRAAFGWGPRRLSRFEQCLPPETDHQGDGMQARRAHATPAGWGTAITRPEAATVPPATVSWAWRTRSPFRVSTSDQGRTVGLPTRSPEWRFTSA
jgi:hypothetical protein